MRRPRRTTASKKQRRGGEKSQARSSKLSGEMPKGNYGAIESGKVQEKESRCHSSGGKRGGGAGPFIFRKGKGSERLGARVGMGLVVQTEKGGRVRHPEKE